MECPGFTLGRVNETAGLIQILDLSWSINFRDVQSSLEPLIVER